MIFKLCCGRPIPQHLQKCIKNPKPFHKAKQRLADTIDYKTEAYRDPSHEKSQNTFKLLNPLKKHIEI